MSVPSRLQAGQKATGIRLWSWYATHLSCARQKDHWLLRILREAGPCLTLLGLAHLLPGQDRPSFLRGNTFDFLFGLLFGMGATWTVTFGFTRLPHNGWRWVRFLGMGALGVVLLFWAGEGVGSLHNTLCRTQGTAVWATSMASVPSFLAACVLTILFAVFLSRIERHRREAEEQRRLAEDAQGAALRSRLAPHFIFNALNTLHAQIEQDPKGAEATTERLAHLFRQVVEAAEVPRVPLKQELAFVEAYLGIEQARLGDRLKVSVEVPEDLESVEVPPLSLQILVENAVKHGVTPLERGGEIRIGAKRAGDVLKLWVEDPGNGVSSTRGTGTALEILRQRLEKPEDLEMGMADGRHRVSFRWRLA